MVLVYSALVINLERSAHKASGRTLPQRPDQENRNA